MLFYVQIFIRGKLLLRHKVQKAALSKNSAAFNVIIIILKAAVALSVYPLATGWTTEVSEFESWKGQGFSILCIV
jgi:hypothetical protein